MAENLSQIKLGAPRSIEGGEAPNASISVQVMEECQSIALTDGSQPCTRQGAVAAGAALIGQWLAQVTEQASGLCSVEFASVDDMMAYFGLGTGTMWQDGEVEKRVGGLRLRVADADALAAALGEEVIADVVDADGCVKPEAVCFVGGETLEGNALRGTADGCAVTGYGYGVVRARLWQKPDVLLSELRVALGVGAVTDSGEYHGESCPEGKVLLEAKGVIGQYPKLGLAIVEHPDLAKIIEQYPNIVPALVKHPSAINGMYRKAYIETDGNSVFDTGIVMAMDGMNITSYFNLQMQQGRGFLGVDNGSYNICRVTTGGIGSRGGLHSTTFNLNTDYELKIEKDGFSKNGVKTTANVNYRINNGMDTMFIAAINSGGGVASGTAYTIGKFYDIKAEKDRQILAWVVPTADNLYVDIINDIEYNNLGTGNAKFVKVY